MLWNLVALYVPQSQSAAKLFDKGLYDLQSKGQLERLIKPYSQAAAAGAARTSARWPAARLQYAVAWNTNPGRLIKVADTSGTHQTQARKMVPALYTADQATKGALAYYQELRDVSRAAAGWAIRRLFRTGVERSGIRRSELRFSRQGYLQFRRQADASSTPGSLTHEQDVQIMAFILQQNGYPPGSKELRLRRGREIQSAVEVLRKMTYAKKVGYLPATILIAGGASDLGANVYVTWQRVQSQPLI